MNKIVSHQDLHNFHYRRLEKNNHIINSKELESCFDIFE